MVFNHVTLFLLSRLYYNYFNWDYLFIEKTQVFIIQKKLFYLIRLCLGKVGGENHKYVTNQNYV